MWKLIIQVLLLSLVGVTFAQQLGSTISFRGDWEAGLSGLGNWANLEWARPNVSIKLITDPVRQGKYAARFEVTQDDYVNSGERAEASQVKNATGYINRAENVPGTIFFYAFSAYLPSPFVWGSSWTIFMQLHGPNTPPYDRSSPSFAFSAEREYAVFLNGGMKNGTGNNAHNIGYKFNDYVAGSGDILTESWDDFVFEIKWDIENQSYVNGWRRRWGQGEKQFTQVLRVSNVSTLMYDQLLIVNGNGTGGLVRDAHYMKHGIYRGSPKVTPNATIAILDGFTRALTFEDAAYGAFGDGPAAPNAVPSAPSGAPYTQPNQPGTTPLNGKTPESSSVTSDSIKPFTNKLFSVSVVTLLFGALC